MTKTRYKKYGGVIAPDPIRTTVTPKELSTEELLKSNWARDFFIPGHFYQLLLDSSNVPSLNAKVPTDLECVQVRGKGPKRTVIFRLKLELDNARISIHPGVAFEILNKKGQFFLTPGGDISVALVELCRKYVVYMGLKKDNFLGWQYPWQLVDPVWAKRRTKRLNLRNCTWDAPCADGLVEFKPFS